MHASDANVVFMINQRTLKAAFRIVAWDLTTAAAGASIGALTAAVFALSLPWQFLLAGAIAGGVAGAVAAAGTGRLATAWRGWLETTRLSDERRDVIGLLIPAVSVSLVAILGGVALAATGSPPAEVAAALVPSAWAGAMWGTGLGFDRPDRPAPESPCPPASRPRL